MLDDFKVQSHFIGYITKPDETNVPTTDSLGQIGIALIKGSQNVLINDAEKVAPRLGYELDGDADPTIAGIESSFDWLTSTNSERNLRAGNGKLQYRFVDSDEDISYIDLMTGLPSTEMQFTTWWDTNENIDLLLFVDGRDKIHKWSGAVTTLASVTVNSITKQGSTTFAQERFFTLADKQIVINGIVYTYTGGETSDTLTGVTPDPTLGGHAVGSVIQQQVVSYSNEPVAGFNNDSIRNLNNNVSILSKTSREVYTSKNTDFTDFSFSSPRLSGEGHLLTLDNYGVGFEVDEEALYIGAGKDDWYKVEYEQVAVGSTLAETVKAKKLKTGSGQGPQSQNLITKIKNSIAFISNEPTLDTLGRIENINTPQSRPLSDPIKPDFNSEDFDGGDMKYFRNQLFITAPASSKMYILDFDKGFWQPPQIGPFGKLAIIDGELYSHSPNTPETYKIFVGTDDNGNNYKSVARFAYRNFGSRKKLKAFDEWYVEGNISENTQLTQRLYFDFRGSTSIREKIIDGANEEIIFVPAMGAGLGDNSQGDVSLSGESTSDSNLPKFRVITEWDRDDFFEVSDEYETDGIDQQWAILATGPNAEESSNEPIFIKT